MPRKKLTREEIERAAEQMQEEEESQKKKDMRKWKGVTVLLAHYRPYKNNPEKFNPVCPKCGNLPDAEKIVEHDIVYKDGAEPLFYYKAPCSGCGEKILIKWFRDMNHSIPKFLIADTLIREAGSNQEYPTESKEHVERKKARSRARSVQKSGNQQKRKRGRPRKALEVDPDDPFAIL